MIGRHGPASFRRDRSAGRKRWRGFNLPISGGLSSPDAVVEIAQGGEALGFDYLTVTHHTPLLYLQGPGYPDSESGAFRAGGPEPRREQLTSAAYIAAKTSRSVWCRQ